jgi:chromosomal replication initiator protein
MWSEVQAELALAVGEPTYRIWLAALNARELRSGRLVVEAPQHARRWIAERFGSILQQTLATVAGPGTIVQLIAAGDGDDGTAGDRRGARWAHAAAPALTSAARGNPKLTFEQFVIGNCNRFAHAAALAVAEMPAHAYNPLFICGPPGVGKTHLLGAIAALLDAHHPTLAVRVSTGEAFTNEFLDALTCGRTDVFKARFRHVDVLLLDDIHFIERKAKTEEEFFHTFNTLTDSGRQVVITSDRPPDDLQSLEDRLRERFKAGLVAEMGAPDLGTRVAILRKRVQHDHIELDDETTLQVIAERIDTNVRALEGALIRTVAFGSLTGRHLTPQLATEVLDSLYLTSAAGSSSKRGSLADIQRATCEYFGLSGEELLSNSRARRVAWPRQLAMYLAREFTRESLPAIGRQFGGRDHTTVLHAWRRTSLRLVIDEVARRDVMSLCQQLKLPTRPAPGASPDRCD